MILLPGATRSGLIKNSFGLFAFSIFVCYLFKHYENPCPLNRTFLFTFASPAHLFPMLEANPLFSFSTIN